MTFSKEELEFLDDAISELVSQDYWDCYGETAAAAFLLWDKIREKLKQLDDV